MSFNDMGAISHLGAGQRDNRHTGGWNIFTNGQSCGVIPGIPRPCLKICRVTFLNIRSS